MFTNLLIKIFVKDHGEALNNETRNKYAFLASITGILSNTLLFLFKIVIGLISGSVAIIADALNNMTDVGSSVITLVGFKMSEKHEDKEHPLGHGRYEYITAFIVEFMIIVVGIELFKTSISKIFNPTETKITSLTLIILFLAILVKLWMTLFYRKIGKRINSSALNATAIDSLSDVITTTFVIVSALVSMIFKIQIDGYAGLLISIFILFSGLKAAKETVGLLLGGSPDPEFVNAIHEFTKKYPEILGIHDLMIHDYGPGRKIITLHAEVSEESNINHAHDIVDSFERDMQEHFGCIVTIHLDPIAVNDEYVIEAKEFTNKIIKEFDDSFSIHDFRINRGENLTTVIFDLCIPMDSKLKDKEAEEVISKLISDKNPSYRAVIHAEHPYI